MVWAEERDIKAQMKELLPQHGGSYDPKRKSFSLRHHTGKLLFLAVLLLWCSTLLPNRLNTAGERRSGQLAPLYQCINSGQLQQTTYRDFAEAKPVR
jgi:hypothetical protein